MYINVYLMYIELKKLLYVIFLMKKYFFVKYFVKKCFFFIFLSKLIKLTNLALKLSLSI